MVIYPILGRELKRAARKPLLYWLRTGTVVCGVIIGIILLHGTQFWHSGAAVGRELFRITIWVAFTLCLLSGVLLTSTLLCEERLLGKLTAVSLLACQIVLGLFPLIALCIVLGGVSLAEFSRAVQLLLVTLLFSLSVGLFVSALNKQVSRAVLLTFATTVLSSALVFAADWMARRALAPWRIGPIVPGLLPAMTALLDPFYSHPPQKFSGLPLVPNVPLCRLADPRRAYVETTFNPERNRQARPPSKLSHFPHLQIFDFSREARLLAIFGMTPLRRRRKQNTSQVVSQRQR